MSIPARTRIGLTIVCFIFLAQAWPFVRGLGIEVDEAIVGNGIYPRIATFYAWHFGNREIPVMLLTYMGALKTWLYSGLFALVHPGPVSLRLPMLLAGVVAILLFFRLTDRIAGRAAAWIGVLLLATDPSFLLTEAVDLGSVALQHVFKLGAILLLMRFHRTGSWRSLALGFFLLGLGLWDKAVFLWVLAGLGVAAIAVFPREVAAHLRWRKIAIAAAAFVAGALPFAIYNFAHPLETFRANVNLSAENRFVKAHLLRESANGHVMTGYLTADNSGPNPGVPHRFTQRVAFAVDEWFRHPATNWIIPVWLTSVLALPLVGRSIQRRAGLFALVYLALAWLQMFLTAGAGGAVHHIILLWPFHLLMIAVVFAQLSLRLGRFARPALAVLVLLVGGRNVLVNNHYYVELVRNGGSVRWTDAFRPLIDYLRQSASRQVLLIDWGISETMNLISEGDIPSVDLSFGLRDSAGDPQFRGWVLWHLEKSNTLVVGHTDRYEEWPGMNATIDQIAAMGGFHREPVRQIRDRNRRPVFEVFRFVKEPR